MLDRARLGKQRIEVLQILQTLSIGPYQCNYCKKSIKTEIDVCIECRAESNIESKTIKTSWYNHPITQAWKNYEDYLIIYGRIICKEWTKRGYKDTCRNKINDYRGIFKPSIDRPPWLGDERLHLSHKSNLIRKNPTYYRPIFGLDIPDDIPYFWPV